MSDEGNKLYVGNLDYTLTEDELSSFCSEKGVTAQSVRIIKDKYTDRSKGFGFVELASDANPDQAIEMLNGQQINGRALKVSQARKRDNSTGGGSSGGGFRGGQDRQPKRW
ncbi:MAG: RNA-binding protein [Candidatus Omnitrophota bacterium]